MKIDPEAIYHGPEVDRILAIHRRAALKELGL